MTNISASQKGVVRRRVTRVAQNMLYDQAVVNGYIKYATEEIIAGKYMASDIVNIDATNVDFDLEAGSTLVGRGERTIGCAATGSSARYTGLLGVTTDW
jgi:hypothetical protein